MDLCCIQAVVHLWPTRLSHYEQSKNSPALKKIATVLRPTLHLQICMSEPLK